MQYYPEGWKIDTPENKAAMATQAALADALREEQRATRRPVRELILEHGTIPEEQLIEALSAVSGIPVVRLYEHPVPLEARQLVRPDLLRENVVMPFAFDEGDGGVLLVAK